MACPRNLLFSLVLVFTSCFTFLIGNGEQTFIIRVQNDEKPAVFPTPEHWYRSTLRNLDGFKPTKNTEPNNHNDLIHVYKTVFHGFTAKLSYRQAEEITKRPGVLAVFPDQLRRIHTTRSPQFLGLNTNGGGLLAESDYGSNLVIGMFDSGIWPESRSFNDRGLDPVPPQWKGECEEGTGFSKTACNRKLVGARFFPAGYEATAGAINVSSEYRSPRDSNGHGTHTASTAAGRYVRGASMQGYAGGIAAGMAPKARLAVYKICWSSGCFDSDIIAAFDKAVQDGVDVISLSLGSDPVPYYQDPIAIGAFGAMEKGVFVSASAGNSGPGQMTVTNVSPWITTVGAGTLDRNFPADILLADGRIITGASIYSGKGLSPRRFLPLIYAGDAASVTASYFAGLCMEGSLNPDAVRGKIVLCDIGSNSRLGKGAVVKKAGGLGMILANRFDDGEDLIVDPHVLPAVAVGATAGFTIHGYINSSRNPGATMVFRGTKLGVKPAPVVASFSSRGPNAESPVIIKPDVIAPGVNVLAAWPKKDGPARITYDQRQTAFNIISGTSMSCPHVSGLAALLKGAHPEWSPAGIRSALMTTAYTRDNTGKILLDETSGATSTVWGFGSGHVHPVKAVDPGLIYDLTVEDYLDFLCNSNYSDQNIRAITRRGMTCPRKKGRPGDLNYPSIAVVFEQKNGLARYEAVITRTVTNVGLEGSSYTVTIIPPKGTFATVEPDKLDFSRKNHKLKYVVKIRAESAKLPAGNSKTTFGKLTWSDGKHTVSSPISVTWQQKF